MTVTPMSIGVVAGSGRWLIFRVGGARRVIGGYGLNAVRRVCQAVAVVADHFQVRSNLRFLVAGAAGDPGGGVQDPVAESGDLAAGGVGVVAEPDQLCPRDEIGCCHDDLKPCCVRGEVVAGETAEAGCFGLPDPVLDPGVLAVP